MKTFITALALGLLIAVPAFLRSANAAPPIDAARARAIHECNVAASTYKAISVGPLRERHVSGLYG
jgi:hypothetical protein